MYSILKYSLSLSSCLQTVEAGFCPSPWIPYNGHCFYLNRTKKTWPAAQTECAKSGGSLASIGNIEDKSFVISQLGYGTALEGTSSSALCDQ